MRNKGTRRSAALIAMLLASTAAEAQFNLKSVLGALTQPQQKQQSQQQNNGSDAAGAVGCGAGAAIGASVFKPTWAKVLAGAVLCAAGWKLGKAITTPRDKQALTDHSAELMSRDGPVSDAWQAPDSHETIQLQTSAASQQQREFDMQVDQQVDAPPAGFVVAAKTYIVVPNRLNFRKSPMTGAPNIIGFFNKGDHVEVIGFTPDSNWAIVGDNGVIVGYAAIQAGAATLLVPQGTALPTASAAVAPAPRARPRILRTASATVTNTTVSAVRAQDAPVNTIKVSASTQCKAVTATFGKRSDTHTGCALPKGGWAIA